MRDLFTSDCVLSYVVIVSRTEKGTAMAAKKKVSLARVVKAVEADDNSGFCMACGAKAHGVEPDARNYKCESCGKPEVFGAEELLLYMAH